MKAENNLETDQIRQLVWRLAIPSMLAQFVSVFYSIVDRIYIGNIPEIGELALAGVGVCGPVVTMVTSVASWVGVGGAQGRFALGGQGAFRLLRHHAAEHGQLGKGLHGRRRRFP